MDTTRRGLLRRRRSNRRVVVQRKALLVWLLDGLAALGRLGWKLLKIVGKLVAAAGLLVGLVIGGRWAYRHVVDSPRFALRQVLVGATERVSLDEIRALAGVEEGDRLLELDTDAIAARVAEHPWIEAVRVRRQLPGTLSVEVVEREAAAVTALGALYLIDAEGRPFKRATMDEADGLPVVTGLEREQYVEAKVAVEAAHREALAVIAAYAARPGRPALSEVNVHPRHGFTLYLLEGGAEVRLGRGRYDEKLARLDRILDAVKANGPEGLAAVRVVHLDGDRGNLVPVRMAENTPPEPAPVAAEPARGQSQQRRSPTARN
jgi:cell division protein FtsQ